MSVCLSISVNYASEITGILLIDFEKKIRFNGLKRIGDNKEEFDYAWEEVELYYNYNIPVNNKKDMERFLKINFLRYRNKPLVSFSDYDLSEWLI